MSNINYKINGRSLSTIREDHILEIKDWRNAQIRVLRQTKLLTDDDQFAWFQSIQNSKDQILFSILESRDSKDLAFIGYCGITNIDRVNNRGEISFLVNPARVADKFLYREDFLSVLYLLSLFGFEKVGFHKLFTETYAFRNFHIGILEEFGFKCTGRLRDHVFIEGEYCDSMMHSMVESEWPEIKKRS